MDILTGLQYNRRRWYAPNSGRWISEDPASFASSDSNLYRYVGNNSLGATDPTGLILSAIGKGIIRKGEIADLDQTADGGTPYANMASQVFNFLFGTAPGTSSQYGSQVPAYALPKSLPLLGTYCGTDLGPTKLYLHILVIYQWTLPTKDLGTSPTLLLNETSALDSGDGKGYVPLDPKNDVSITPGQSAFSARYFVKGSQQNTSGILFADAPSFSAPLNQSRKYKVDSKVELKIPQSPFPSDTSLELHLEFSISGKTGISIKETQKGGSSIVLFGAGAIASFKVLLSGAE